MAKDYHIGRFTEPVRFLRPERTITATGERQTSWLPDACRFCEVSDSVRSAGQTQDALAEEQDCLLKTWHVHGASTEWKVSYMGATFDVVKVERQRYGITYYYIRRTDLCNE